MHDDTGDDETENDEEEIAIRKVIINNTLPIQQEYKITSVTPVITTRTKQVQPIEKATAPVTTSENVLQHTVVIDNDNTAKITSTQSHMINTPARSDVMNEQLETTCLVK